MAQPAYSPRGEVVQVLTPMTTQRLAVGATATVSAVLAPFTDVVRIVSTVDCHVRVGVGATTQDMLLPAGTVEYIRVPGGSVLSAIRGATDGFLFITEVL